MSQSEPMTEQEKALAIADALEPAMLHIEEADEEYRLDLARLALRAIGAEGTDSHYWNGKLQALGQIWNRLGVPVAARRKQGS